jgi:tetratricopeptide (TPR) repeat protein
VRILRIKQAEAALAGGRLDEACELLADADVRSCRQAQQLLDGLIDRLVVRGKEHLAAGRMPQALADCQKAAELGGNIPAAGELRERIAEALAGQHNARRAHGDALSAARRHADAGRLSQAEQLLVDARLGHGGDDSTRAGLLRREVDVRRQSADEAARRCRAAMDRGDLAAAVDELLAARTQRATNDELAELSAKVVEGCVEQARRELNRGRIDLAETLLARAELPCGSRPAVAELKRAVVECRHAAAASEAGHMRQAAEMLRRARAILPDAAWVVEAVEAVDRAAHAAETLRSGPLGMIGGLSGCPTGPAPVLPPVSVGGENGHGHGRRNVEKHDTESPAPACQERPNMPGRFVIQLDGAGSSLVFTGPRVTAGPISSMHRPDLGLLADANLPIVSVERTDEGDYFLACQQPVEVNDRPVTGKLLADGDKIALSPRCRLRFRLPTPASTTAVLELSTARVPQADIRRVILMDRELVIGPGPSAHVRADDLPARAVLQPADGRLLCRTDCELTRESRPVDPAEGIPFDSPVRIGPLGMVVNRA